MYNDLAIPQYHNKNTVPCMKCQYHSAQPLSTGNWSYNILTTIDHIMHCLKKEIQLA